jgi:hypothetical protein
MLTLFRFSVISAEITRMFLFRCCLWEFGGKLSEFTFSSEVVSLNSGTSALRALGPFSVLPCGEWLMDLAAGIPLLLRNEFLKSLRRFLELPISGLR